MGNSGFRSESAEKRIVSVRETIDVSLREILRGRNPKIIYDAMSYSVFAGGKRLRPLLLVSFCEMFGGSLERAIPFACAIEMIHTYSLIHDDLPALDDDDMRRGKASNHVKYGEAMAVLAGDGLLNLAYEVMAEQCTKDMLPGSVAAMSEIAACAGVRGMIGGQVVDIASEGQKISAETLDYLIANKTAKLFRAAICGGGILAGASREELDRLSDFSQKFGLAFQIKDDILNATGNTEKLGKSVGSDEKRQKQTYVSIYGIQKASNDYNRLSGELFRSLDEFGGESAVVRAILMKAYNRES